MKHISEADFWILDRMCEILERKYKKKTKHKITMDFKYKDDACEKLDKGIFSYDMIWFEIGRMRCSTKENKEDFFRILKILEEERTLEKMYVTFRYFVMKENAGAFDITSENTFPRRSTINDYIIVLTIIAMFLIYFKFF